MAKIINLTPHAVSIVDENGAVKASFPSNGVARAEQKVVSAGTLNGIELVSMQFGQTDGLPAPSEDIYYIVSLTTANAAKAEGRTTADLLLTSMPVRDDSGHIIGCRALALIQ